MRTQVLFLFAFLGGGLMAQKEPVITIPYDSTSHAFAYSEVVEVGDLGPSVLYRNAKTWLVSNNGDTTFVDAVLDTKLMDRGVLPVTTIVESGRLKTPFTSNVSYTVTLEFKSGRYRYTINKFCIGGDGTAAAPGMSLETYVKQHESMKAGKEMMMEQEEQLCSGLEAEVKKLIDSMKAGVKAPKKTDDW